MGKELGRCCWGGLLLSWVWIVNNDVLLGPLDECAFRLEESGDLFIGGLGEKESLERLVDVIDINPSISIKNRISVQSAFGLQLEIIGPTQPP